MSQNAPTPPNNDLGHSEDEDVHAQVTSVGPRPVPESEQSSRAGASQAQAQPTFGCPGNPGRLPADAGRYPQHGPDSPVISPSGTARKIG
jgi:hypothetical protein